MENLLLSFRVVAPLMLYIAVGALLRKTGIVDRPTLRGVNNIVFYASLPVLCFQKIAASDLSSMVETPFLLYIALAILLLFVLSSIIVPRVCKDDRRRGVLILGVFRSNDAIFGLGVAAALLGDDHLTLMTLAIALTVPLFNVLSVLAMERYRGGKVNVWQLLLRVIKNPIVLGCLAGFAANFTHLQLPDFINTPLSGLSALCTPLAFVSLGGTIAFSALRKNALAITVVNLLRLIIIPVAVIGTFLLLGYRGEPIVVIMILFGAPVAIVTYSMAVGVGADDELAGGLLAVSSLLSIVTMFLFIFVLKQLALI